jgi:trehalose-6-phosphatase
MKTSKERQMLEPTSQIISTLNDLSKDERNTVIVISSNLKSLMHAWYAKRAPSLGLAAENGFFWRLDSEEKSER